MSRAILPLVDRALDGQLKPRLQAARDAGQSYDEIARSLIPEGVTVTGETVRRWCLTLGIQPKEPAA